MLKLVFAESGPAPTLELGPVQEVRIDGENMRPAPDGETVARHYKHVWRVHGREFFRVDCSCLVKIHFENQDGESSEVFGPFLHFSCADRIAYGDICANIDLESKQWYCHRNQKYWQSMVVKSAAAPA
ncbi:MAG: hypothetical protein ACRDRT_19275 [Pseudonocardiaceae bacterium]